MREIQIVIPFWMSVPAADLLDAVGWSWRG
jgi:hypothetical protein